MRHSPPHRAAPCGLALALACVSALGAVAAGCGSDDAGDPTCEGTLADVVRARGLVPEPAVPGLPPPDLHADRTAAGLEGLVVDPAPLARGEHAVDRWFRDPTTCAVAGGAYPWGPPPPTTRPPASATLPSLASAPSSVRALVVLGPDAGAAEDGTVWAEALAALNASGALLHAPTRRIVEEELEVLCDGAGPRDAVIVVATGRGTAAAGGGLLLASEAIGWERLGGLIASRCGGAAVRVVVADASWAEPLGAALAGAPPTLLWRASDAAHPDAPRRAPRAGGLLSAVLADHVTARAEAACLTAVPPDPAEVAWVFSGAEDVVAAMRARRWASFGEPALASQGADLADRTGLRERLAAALEGPVPDAPLLTLGEPPAGTLCAVDVSCTLRAKACEASPCRTLRCVGGLCLPGPDVGAPCDDGTPCTEDDACDAQGLCRGEPVDCDDGNPCTVETCLVAEGCVAEPVAEGAPCDDGSTCTVDDRCDGDAGCAGTDVDCDDGDPCTSDACDEEAGCVYGLSKAPCDDGDPCTGPDFCRDGLCRSAPIPCDDGNPCTLDACAPGEGCVFPPLPDGLPCDDGDACTTQDRCLAGACAGVAALCDDGLDCTLDLCEAGTCQHLPEPGTCATDDGCIPVGAHPPEAPCLVCKATAQLVPDPAAEGGPCPDDGIPCTADVCQGGACVHPDQPGSCHRPDGTCVGIGEALTPCLVCTATGVGTPIATGAPCDDGDGCTVGDVCGPTGQCAGAPAPCCPLDGEAGCTFTVQGTTAPAAVEPGAVTAWACLAGLAFPGPERAHPFVAPCDGAFTLQYVGPPGSLLFVLKGQPGLSTPVQACEAAECFSYTAGPITLLLSAGEPLLLVVDHTGLSQGAYTVAIDCPCSGTGP